MCDGCPEQQVRGRDVAGARFSNRCTSAPRLAKWYAIDAPMMPPPTTAMRRGARAASRTGRVASEAVASPSAATK